jgi:hypothetical protein
MDELERMEKDALEELKDLLEDDPTLDPHDLIFEIVDSSCPIYTSDILQLAADNIFLATTEPEIGPAFDGSPTPVNIITANIFEHLEQVLWDNLEDIKQEIEDEKTRCYYCDEEIGENELIGDEVEDENKVLVPICVECYQLAEEYDMEESG